MLIVPDPQLRTHIQADFPMRPEALLPASPRFLTRALDLQEGLLAEHLSMSLKNRSVSVTL
jgi:hypothetical protein